MDYKLVVALTAIALLGVYISSAMAVSDCPASRPNFSPYNRVEILPKGYKLVDEPFIVKAVRVDDKEETPISSRTVKIYYYENGIKSLIDSGETNRQGEYSYTPDKLGKYTVECAGRAPSFDVKMLLDEPSDFGAVCGNGICESGKMENNENCPVDCTICGDALCEGNEDKENCPDDCIICGDGECDPEEYTPTSCSCIEDCLVCGDGVCDNIHGETPEGCPDDCLIKEETKEVELSQYYLPVVILLLVIVLFMGRDKIAPMFKRGRGNREPTDVDYEGESTRPRKKKGGERRETVLADDEILDIIRELRESGISDRRINEKLKEFGLSKKESEELVKRAKKS